MFYNTYSNSCLLIWTIFLAVLFTTASGKIRLFNKNSQTRIGRIQFAKNRMQTGPAYKIAFYSKPEYLSVCPYVCIWSVCKLLSVNCILWFRIRLIFLKKLSFFGVAQTILLLTMKPNWIIFLLTLKILTCSLWFILKCLNIIEITIITLL